MRFSYLEKYGTEKISYSYIAHAMWNNKNEPRKKIDRDIQKSQFNEKK